MNNELASCELAGRRRNEGMGTHRANENSWLREEKNRLRAGEDSFKYSSTDSLSYHSTGSECSATGSECSSSRQLPFAWDVYTSVSRRHSCGGSPPPIRRGLETGTET